MRIPVAGLATALVALTLTSAPVVAQENLGLCEADEARRADSTIKSGLWFCFDGNTLWMRNESTLVLAIAGGSEPRRTQDNWSPGGDEVIYGTAGPLAAPIVDDRVLPPGYSLQLRIGATREEVSLAPDTDNSSVFAKKQAVAAFYGFVPVAGDFVDITVALNDYIGEMDDISIKYLDCQRRATNFFQGASCNLIHKRDVTFARGRALVKGVPALNDAPKIVRNVQSALSGALALDTFKDQALTPIIDLGDWKDGHTIIIPASNATPGPLGVLAHDSFALVPFETAADEAIAELARFPGDADRDSGWQELTWWSWTADGSEGIYSDIPEDPAAPNTSEYPEVRFLCWDTADVSTCAVFTGDGNGRRWLSGWDQSVGEAGWDGQPVAPGTTFTTTDGFWAGGPTGALLNHSSTELRGGEGGMLLFTSGSVSGRLAGVYPQGGGQAQPGEMVFCIEAGLQPQSGFGYNCGVIFPVSLDHDEGLETGLCTAGETPVFVADYDTFGVSICMSSSGLIYRGVKLSTGEAIEVPACADPHGGEWLAKNGPIDYVVNDQWLRVYDGSGSLIVDEYIVQYEYYGDLPNTGC